ncbi:MAG: HDOD domain-containing protein, partial [Pseudomonadota bacterium]|nr:HDOD domain-containing protein [Pseudomonadota bacterium]
MSLDKYVSYAAKSFTLPDICVRLRSTLDDPRSSAEDIGELISADPSLTAKVLRLANSSLFRFPSQVESVAKAISVIGGEALYNLVIAETASTAFKRFDTKLINLDKHWYASVYCGMVAKSLAMRLNVRGAERFFVMGILQNLSELVVAKKETKRYQSYLNAETNGLPHVNQLEHFGFTFAQCSGIILENW